MASKTEYYIPDIHFRKHPKQYTLAGEKLVALHLQPGDPAETHTKDGTRSGPPKTSKAYAPTQADLKALHEQGHPYIKVREVAEETAKPVTAGGK